MSRSAPPILTVDDLTVDFLSDEAPVRAVDSVSFQVSRGETLVILGESGSGKSVSTGAVMDLIDQPPGDIIGGRISFEACPSAASTERRAGPSTAGGSP